MSVGTRMAALVGVGVVAVGCASGAEGAVGALGALPSLGDFPAGYSLLGAPESFESALPAPDDRMAFGDERCRVLIEPPAGPGAGESVASGVGAGVYLLHIVESDRTVSEVASAVAECGEIRASSHQRSLALTRGTVTPATATTVGYRYRGTQGVRHEQQMVETPMQQQRLVGRAGEYLVSMSVTVLARPGETLTEASIEAESEVLRTVFDRTLERLGG
ncbi:hypothetical protein [Nocardia lasii]|uniref:DUF5642 domain-containing protein n=1 Tax=Nocardia lasii TaxID=1616107 RepID=A0ABW1JTG1_9NOCA